MIISPETHILLRCAVFLAVAVPITWIDLHARRIPDVWSLGGLAALILVDLAADPASIPASAACGAFSFLVFWLIRKFTVGLGFGDIKYAALLGYFAGFRLLPVVLLTAAGAGLGFILISRLLFRMPKGVPVAFGPFLSAGGLVAALFMLI